MSDDPMDAVTSFKQKSKLEKHMAQETKVRKVPTSIYLRPEVLEKLSETARKYKVSNSKMVEILVDMGLKGE